jgi:hypothetical protein
MAPIAMCAPPVWADRGTFEVCLEDKAGKWLRRQAELVVTQDAEANRLDDAVVAQWTVEALAQCQVLSSPAEASAEDRFARYMARWRGLIYEVASEIRREGGAE